MTLYLIDQLPVLSSGNSLFTISFVDEGSKDVSVKPVKVSPFRTNSMISNLPPTVEEELTTVSESSGLLLCSPHATVTVIFGSNFGSS